MLDAQRIEAVVHGIVQGVFFRYHTKIEADRLGLSGTVRNLPDGTVEVVVEGRVQSLDRFLDWVRHGPELAVVERVEVRWTRALETQSGFRILR